MRVLSIRYHGVKSCNSLLFAVESMISAGCEKLVIILYRNVAKRGQKALQRHCSARKTPNAKRWQSDVRRLIAIEFLRVVVQV
jgi:hypothetical protein